MASINVNFPPPPSSKGFTYSDLNYKFNTPQLVTNEVEKQIQVRDITVDYDLAAIRNSITNFFLTSPGEKLLNPDFGVDLRYFLFYPVSDVIAFSIKQEILRNITLYDPRILINNLSVVAEYETHQYTINISVGVPSLGVKEFIINLHIDSQGYITFI